MVFPHPRKRLSLRGGEIGDVNGALFENHLFIEAFGCLILNHRISNLQTVVEKDFSKAAVRLWSGV
jgi:hypothetical protein